MIVGLWILFRTNSLMAAGFGAYAVVDCTRKCLAPVAGISLSALRVAREVDRIIEG